MKKLISISILIGLVIISAFGSLNLTQGYETDSSTRLSLEQSSNNFELLGQMGSIGTTTYYQSPKIDSNSLNHDLTRIDITRLQQYTNNQTIRQYQQNAHHKYLNQSFGGLGCDAPFDSRFTLNLNYNRSQLYNDYSSGFEVKTGVYSSGDLDSLKTADTNYLKATGNNYYLNATSNNGGGLTLSSGTIADTQVQDSASHSFSGYSGGGFFTQSYMYYYFPTETATEYTIEWRVYCGSSGTLTYFARTQSWSNIFTYTTSITAGSWFTSSWTGTADNIYCVGFGMNCISDMSFDLVHVKAKRSSQCEISLNYTRPRTLVNNTIPANVSIRPFINSGSISELKVNGQTVSFNSNIFNNYTFYFNYGSNFSIWLESTSSYDNSQLYVDYVILYPALLIVNYSQVDIHYKINLIEYEANLTLSELSYSGNQTYGNITYAFDTTQFTLYDHIQDMTMPVQNITYNITLLTEYNLTFYTLFSSSEWAVPSEINLKINEYNVEDETYNSGYVSLLEYPEQLEITADNTNLLFNFSILSQFSYTIDLDIISRSYFSKTLQLSTYHALSITQVEYLFDSDIKHSYLNNHDYGSTKTILPLYDWTAGSTVKIEVILDDTAYLPLEKVGLYTNQSSLLTIFARTNAFSHTNIGTQFITYGMPGNFQADSAIIDLSNIRFTEPYTHAENTTYLTNEETQTIPDPVLTRIQNQAEYIHIENSTNITYFETQNHLPTITTISNSSERFEYYNIQNTTRNETILQNSTNTILTGEFKGSWTMQNGSSPLPQNIYSDGSVSVVDYKYHKNVLFYDNTGNNIWKWGYVEQGPTFGNATIELYTAFTDPGSTLYNSFYIEDDNGDHQIVQYEHWYADQRWQLTDDLYASFTVCYTGFFGTKGDWIHLKMEFDYTNNELGLYLNNTYYGKRAFKAGFGAISKFEIRSCYSANDFYYDSISFDWCGTYQIGDLLYEQTDCLISERRDLSFTEIQFSNIRNMSITYEFKSNISTMFNYSITNWYLNQNQTIYQNTSLDLDTHFIHNIQNYTQNFINASTLNITVIFESHNESMFNLELYISIKVFYYNDSNSEVAPNLIASFQSYLYVGQSNNISIQAQHTVNELHTITFWDNITNNVQYLGSTDGNYSVLITNSTSQHYSIGVFLNDTHGNWKQINVTNIFIAKNFTSILMVGTSTYFQWGNLSFATQLYQDNGLIDVNIDLKIYFPNGTLFISRINTTNDALNDTCGWYAINATYTGNNTYLGSSILRVFEVLPAETPSIDLSYQSLIYVGQNANITINVRNGTYPIQNITLYESYNGSISNSTTPFSTIIPTNITKSYFISVLVNDSQGFYQNITVTNLFVAKNTSYFALTNLYQQYYQNQTLNVSTTLNRNVTIALYYPNGTALQSNTNRSIWNIAFNQTGWYRINATFNNDTNRYLNFSIETVFEVLPISRGISDASSVNVKINDTNPTTNRISLLYLGNSFTLNSSCDLGTEYDFNISFTLNYSQNVSYANYGQVVFTFNASAQISTILTTNVSLANYPSFITYYYGGQPSTNYTIFDSQMYLNQANNTYFLNLDSFNFGFRIGDNPSKIQMDPAITTDDESVYFVEYGIANRTFANWYVSESNVNDLTITRLANSREETTAQVTNDFYFSDSQITSGDLFSLDWYLDPGFSISSEILSNNGTYIEVKILVESNFYVENVSVRAPFTLYFDSWTNATQSSMSNIITFFADYLCAGSNTFYLIGTRDVPWADFAYYGSMVNTFMYPNSTQVIPYYAMISYPEYSEAWYLNVSDDWILDGVHYGNTTMVIQNNTFFCSGYDQSITSSYLQFSTNPLNSFDITQNATSKTITLSIDLNLPLNSTMVMFPVLIEGNFDIKTDGISELYELDGYTWFMYNDPMDLSIGTTIIIIEYEIYSLADSWYYVLPILGIMIAGIIWYLRKKSKEKQLKIPEKKNLTKGDKK